MGKRDLNNSVNFLSAIMKFGHESIPNLIKLALCDLLDLPDEAARYNMEWRKGERGKPELYLSPFVYELVQEHSESEQDLFGCNPTQNYVISFKNYKLRRSDK